MNNLENIVIVGSSSELAKEFIKTQDGNKIYKISSNSSLKDKDLFVEDYLNEIDKIINFIKKIDKPIIIFFNGFLAENRPQQFPTNNEIRKTLEINFFIPYQITEALNIENIDIKKFIYISSFAAIKPRYKNFMYGYSKKLLENSINSLNIHNFLFIRFGKINTLMSKSHKTSIFDIEKNYGAEVINRYLVSKTGIVYPDLLTRVLGMIIKITPNKLIKLLNL